MYIYVNSFYLTSHLRWYCTGLTFEQSILITFENISKYHGTCPNVLVLCIFSIVGKKTLKLLKYFSGLVHLIFNHLKSGNAQSSVHWRIKWKVGTYVVLPYYNLFEFLLSQKYNYEKYNIVWVEIIESFYFVSI